jgi:multiple sugar transport system ATP-binding protein
MTKIILKNISKTYPNGQEAVRNVSFEADSGEFLVLVGPSGCGKTTVLRMIAGLESISQGELYFDDKLMNDTLPKERDIGMVFQNYALYPHLTVFANLAFPLTIKKEDKNVIKKNVDEISEMLELSSYLKRKPKELSGGQRQRVALGRALIRKPKAFLFDEPLSNLDAKLRMQMRSEIVNLQRRLGITSIYVTHDQVEAMTMGTKLVVMKDGTVQQMATPEVLYKKPENLFVACFIGSPQMNLFKGKLMNDVGLSFIVENASLKFNFDFIKFNSYQALNGLNVTLGIRAEDIFILNNSSEKESDESPVNTFFSTVSNIEYLGHETLVYIDIACNILCCRSQRKLKLNIGEKIKCGFTSNAIHLFDDKGIRIDFDLK